MGSQYKIVLVGESGAGKTALAYRACYDSFDEAALPTIGASKFQKKVKINEHEVNLDIWDTSGQEKYSSLAPIYFRGCTALIAVYDTSNQQSFEKLGYWINLFREQVSDEPTVFVVGAKNDKKPNVNFEEVDNWAKDQKGDFSTYSTSAMNATGIEELFEKIAEKISKATIITPGATPLPPKPKKVKKRLC